MTSISWQNGSSGNWIDQTVWAPPQGPGAADDVTIDAAGTYTVTLDVAVSINSLTIDTPGDITGGTLALGGLSAFMGVTLDLVNGGIISVDNGASADGGGTISVIGALTNTGTILVGPTDGNLVAGASILAGSLLNEGNVVLSGGVGQDGTNQAALIVATTTPTALTGTYDLSGNATLSFVAGGVTSIVAGALLSEQGAAAVVALAATLSANSGLASLSDISGELDLAGGASVNVGGSLNLSGTLQLDDQGNGGGSGLAVAGTFDNTGALIVGTSAGTLSRNDTIAVAALVNAGIIALNGGRGTNTAQAALSVGTIAPASLTGTYDLTGNAQVAFTGGAITGIASGGSLSESGGAAFMTVAGATAANSALATLGTIAGALDLENGASVVVTGDLSVSGAVTLDGISGNGGAGLRASGALSNSGLILVGGADNTLATSDTLQVAGTLVNSGIIDLSGGTGANTAQAWLDLGGAAPAALTGTYDLDGNALLSFTSGGITSIAPGASLREGDSSARVALASNLSGNSALAGLASIAGMLDLADDIRLTTRAALSVSGALVVDDSGGGGGSVITVAGMLSNSGTIALGPNGALGGAALGASDTIIAAGLLNTGAITLAGGAGASKPQASMLVGAAIASTLTGDISLSGNALLQFTGAAATAIAAGATIAVDGAAARIATGGAPGGNSAITQLSSIAGTLEIDNGAHLAIAGDLAVSGQLLIDSRDGSGFSNVTVAGTITNTGAIFVGQNNVAQGGTASAAGLVNNGEVILRGGATTEARLVITGTAPATTSGDYLLFGNTAVQFGGGAITSIAHGTFLGEDGASGWLALASAPDQNSALASLSSVVGVIDLLSGASIATGGDLAVSGTIVLDSATSTGGSSLTIGGTLSNTGMLTLGPADGSLSASDTITAASLVNTGTIALIGGPTGATTAAAALLLVSGAASNAGTVVIGTGATLAPGGGTFSQSAGLTTLAGTLAGSLTLSGGTVDGGGSVTGALTNTSGSVLTGAGAPSPGTLTVAGGYSQGAGAVLGITLGGSQAGESGELVVSGGTVALRGGTLDLTTPAGVSLAAGEKFQILSAPSGALSGTFAAIDFNGTQYAGGLSANIGNGQKLDLLYNDAAGTVTLAVDSTAPPAQAQVSPGTISVGPVHVGDSVIGTVTVANIATAPAADLDAGIGALGGAATAAGTADLITPGNSASTITAGVTAASDGVLAGTVTLSLASDPADGETPSVLPNQTIAVQGTGYNLAAPSVSVATLPIGHVGDSGTITLTISNIAPADGYSESLAASGLSAEIAAGAAPGTLTVPYTATQPGIMTGTITLNVASDGGIGVGAIDGLGTTALALIVVPVAITIDSPAAPAFETTSTGAITGGAGGAYTLDLGTISQGSGPFTAGFGILNAVSGPADLLSGSLASTGAFTVNGLGAFANLAAGQADIAPSLTLDTSQAGTFDSTITLTPTGTNASGYVGNLPVETLTVEASVVPSVAGGGSGGGTGAGGGTGTGTGSGGGGSVISGAGTVSGGGAAPGSDSVAGPNGTVLYLPFGSAALAALAAPLLAALNVNQTNYVGAAGSATLAAGQSGAVISATGPVSLTGNNGAGHIIAAGSGNFNFTGGGFESGTLIAGAGNDVINNPANDGSWSITLGNGADTVVATGGNNTIATGSGGTLLFLGAGANSVASAGADTVVGGAGAATVAPSANNVLVFSMAGPLEFIGGTGASTVVAGAVAATLFGGASGGSLVFGDGATNYTGGGATDTVVGLAGSMTAQGGAGGGLFFGGAAGNNVITAGSGNVTAFGAGAGDVLTATGNASDLFAGGVGAETLTGANSTGANTFFAGFGPETLVGGAGNTALVAGAGADCLTGGSGLSLFLFVNGRTVGSTDTIAGWNAAHDFVKLGGYTGGTAAMLSAATVSNGSTTIALSDGTHITFAGVTQLSAGSFT